MAEEQVTNERANSIKMNRLYLFPETQERKKEIDRICYLVSQPTSSFYYLRFFDGNHYSVAGEEEVRNFCKQLEEISDEKVREILIEEKRRIDSFWLLFANFQIQRKLDEDKQTKS